RHVAAGERANRAIAAPLEFARDDLALVVVRIRDRGERGGGKQLTDAAGRLTLAVEPAAFAARAHLDDRHQVCGRKDYAPRIAVIGRHVGEPFDVAAEP